MAERAIRLIEHTRECTKRTSNRWALLEMAEAGPDNCRITGHARSLLGKLQKKKRKGDLEELAETLRTARPVLDMLEAVVATGWWSSRKAGRSSREIRDTPARLVFALTWAWKLQRNWRIGGRLLDVAQVASRRRGRFGSPASASLLHGRDGARGCAWTPKLGRICALFYGIFFPYCWSKSHWLLTHYLHDFMAS